MTEIKRVEIVLQRVGRFADYLIDALENHAVWGSLILTSAIILVIEIGRAHGILIPIPFFSVFHVQYAAADVLRMYILPL